MNNPSGMCPICEMHSRRSFEKYGYWIRECGNCGHQFAEIRDIENHTHRIYRDSYFHGGGAGYPNYLADADILTAHGRRYAQLLERYVEPGRLLDIGCAAGFILKGFVSNGWRAVGIEPNQSMATYGREQLGLDIKAVRFEDYDESSDFDLVCMIQVVPHFVDIRRVLAAAAERTRPGGYWLIETWDRDSLVAKLFRSSWHEYSPPSVLHWFSRRSLKALVSEFGFQEIASGRPIKVISLEHIVSLLEYKLADSPLSLFARALGAMKGVRINVPYPGEDIFWILCQKSI